MVSNQYGQQPQRYTLARAIPNLPRSTSTMPLRRKNRIWRNEPTGRGPSSQDHNLLRIFPNFISGAGRRARHRHLQNVWFALLAAINLRWPPDTEKIRRLEDH